MVNLNKFSKAIQVSFVKCFLKSSYIFLFFIFSKIHVIVWLSCLTRKCMGKCLKINKTQYLGYHAIQCSPKLYYTPLKMKNKKVLFCKFVGTIFFYNLQLLHKGFFVLFTSFFSPCLNFKKKLSMFKASFWL